MPGRSDRNIKMFVQAFFTGMVSARPYASTGLVASIALHSVRAPNNSGTAITSLCRRSRSSSKGRPSGL